MDIRTLSIFLKVAEELHFGRAARALGMSAPGVSNAIARLEARVGTRLLIRTTRRVTLTGDGASFYASCNDAIHQIEEAERALSQSSQRPSGVLRINLPLPFGRIKVIPLLPAFMARYPDITLQIYTDRTVDFVSDVDIGFHFGEVRNPSLVARRLALLKMQICGSPAYLDTHGRPARPSELSTHAHIAYIRPHDRIVAGWRLKADSGKGRVRIPFTSGAAAILMDNVDHMVSAACAGLGLIQVVSYLVEREIREGQLEAVTDEYALPGIPMSLVYPKARYASPGVKAFVNFITAQFGVDDS